MADWDDHDWIRRLKGEDQEAQEALWQELFRQAQAMARRYGQSEDMAIDAAEAAYHRVLTRGIYQYNYEAPFLQGFCPVIVVREMLRLLKREGNNRRRLVELPPDLNAPPLPPPQQAIFDRLRPCLELLPERESRILLLIDFWGSPPQEIADALGITRSHVNVLIWRARRKVKDCMEQRGYRSSDDVLDA